MSPKKGKLTRVAIEQEGGEFEGMAAKELLKDDFQLVECNRFSGVFSNLEGGRVDAAIVPIENQTSGGYTEVYTLLLEHNVFITGEAEVRVVLCLVGLGAGDLSKIERIHAHPDALAQCHNFLRKKPWELVPSYNMDEVLLKLQRTGNRNVAAITGKPLAKKFDLKIFKEGIQDYPWNVTRFLLLAKERTNPEGANKTTIAFKAKHVPGALFGCLEGFAKEKLNMTDLVSLPVRDDPRNYAFFVDFEGNVADANVQSCLRIVEDRAAFVRVIGCYKAARTSSKPE
ncbi:MAG: prephenate dehydratase domain-containing protein [Planctomycetota bacterium]|nr:prephenate dehydratase domain-containing protein [Planctomycetota bacterium]